MGWYTEQNANPLKVNGVTGRLRPKLGKGVIIEIGVFERRRFE